MKQAFNKPVFFASYTGIRMHISKHNQKLEIVWKRVRK